MSARDALCFVRFILGSACEAFGDLYFRGRGEYPWRQKLLELESQDHSALRGRWAIVTGSNSGIGFETARLLAKAGLGVILACRSESRGKEAEASLRALLEQESGESKHSVGPVQFMKLDVSDLASVKSFVKALDDRDVAVLVCNAGVLAVPWSLTPQGFEMSIGTNHLGHALLCQLLLPRLRARKPARIVVVSSRTQEGKRFRPELFDKASEAPAGFDRFSLYGEVKAAQLCYLLQLAEETGTGEVSIHAVHPGCVNTSITQNFPMKRVIAAISAALNRFMMISTVEAASYVFRACVGQDTAPEAGTGYYFHCGRLSATNGPAESSENRAAAWRLTQEALGHELQGE
mmetsp:Transcript_26542/g.61977  ORF Transcript_26542/g.61977 Transcript_26542/m.61977 type:complete len:348 (-) Transcript_26542:9-1052(-)